MDKRGKESLKKGVRIAGLFLFTFGIMINLSPLPEITAFAVSENIDLNPITLLGAVTTIVGLTLLTIGFIPKKKPQDIHQLITEGLKEQPM